MTFTPSDIADILVRALPYIRRFTGKVVLIKLGGAAMTDAELNLFAEDVLLLRSVGVRPVVVHGGGPQIGELMQRMGKVPAFVEGQRVTDAETLDIARMVLVGKINRELVAAVNREDPVAVGLSGEDAGLITVVQRDPSLGYVGDVSRVDPSIVVKLLNEGLVPVISTIGRDVAGQAYNVNADAAAAAVAAALDAEKIIYLTGAPGLLEDVKDPTSTISRLTPQELRTRLKNKTVEGGMIPKLQGCADAVEAGVGSAHILDGRTPHALLIELFTDEGIGTMVSAPATQTLAEPGGAS